MINILLITDQLRLHGVFSTCSSIAGINLRTANSLDAAAQEIASAAPTLIFLQDRLSGLSGEIISRHIRNMLCTAQATIVLLSDDTDCSVPKFVDHRISLQNSDDVVAGEAHEVIAGIHAPGTGREKTDDSSQGSHSEIADAVADAVTISSTPATDIPPATATEAVPSQPSQFQERLDTAIEDHDPIAIRFAADDGLSAEVTHPGAGKVLQGERLADFKLPSTTPRRSLWIYGIIPAVAIAAILFFALGGKKQAPKAVLSPPAHEPSRMALKLTQLPSFIPLKGIDHQYGKSHPGWQRYLDGSYEYKVYWSNGSIKALQIIDRSTKGIPGPIIEKVLKEATGKALYTVSRSAVKGNYVVEKGAVESMANIIIYRKQSDRQISGFVVHFD